jgi:hypothetical protein
MIALCTAALLVLQNEELAEAARKSVALESYAFKVEAKANKGKNQPAPVEGRFQKDQPIGLKIGATEGFKKGGTIVTKEGEEWKRLAKPEKGEKKQQPAAAAFSLVKLPHEELEGFEKSFEKVEKAAEKDKDCTVWSGALTPTAARALVSTGGKADGKGNSTYTGTAKVWVNDKGMIVRYEIVSHLKTESPKQGALEVTITKTVEILEPGNTKVEVPEAAAKLLNSQS